MISILAAIAIDLTGAATKGGQIPDEVILVGAIVTLPLLVIIYILQNLHAEFKEHNKRERRRDEERHKRETT